MPSTAFSRKGDLGFSKKSGHMKDILMDKMETYGPEEGTMAGFKTG